LLKVEVGEVQAEILKAGKVTKHYAKASKFTISNVGRERHVHYLERYEGRGEVPDVDSQIPTKRHAGYAYR